jgi:hypothetical protein
MDEIAMVGMRASSLEAAVGAGCLAQAQIPASCGVRRLGRDPFAGRMALKRTAGRLPERSELPRRGDHGRRRRHARSSPFQQPVPTVRRPTVMAIASGGGVDAVAAAGFEPQQLFTRPPALPGTGARSGLSDLRAGALANSAAAGAPSSLLRLGKRRCSAGGAGIGFGGPVDCAP